MVPTQISTPEKEGNVSQHATVELMEIWPDDAKELLARNTNNRRLRPAVIARYAADMTAGRWDVNGESIKVSWDDELIDGQHRLHACVMAAMPFKTAVAFGVDPKARATVDAGLRRGLADYLTWRGDTEVARMASSIAAAWRMEKGWIQSNVAPTNHEAIEWYEANPQIRRAMQLATKLRVLKIPPSATAAVLYLAAQRSEDWDTVEQFVSEAASGLGMTEDSPIYALRRWCESIHVRSGKMDHVVASAMLVKAWNAYVTGRTLKQLAWRRGGKHPEPFPTILAAAGRGAP